MEVEDGLSGAGADVEDCAVSVFDVPLAGDLRGDELASANDFCVVGLGLFQSRKMFLGNDENMGGRLRMNIFEGKDVIVFVNLLGGKLTTDDAAEKAIYAGVSHWSVHRRNDNSIGRARMSAVREMQEWRCAREASQTRDYRATRPGPSLRKKRSLEMTIRLDTQGFARMSLEIPPAAGA